MSVAVYNHYKRLYNNISIEKSQNENSASNQSQQQQQQNRGKLNEFIWLNFALFFVFSGFILNVGIPFYTVPLDSANNPNNLGSTFNANSNEGMKHGSEIIHKEQHDLKLEKSNILMLGPTGSGE